MVAFAAVALGLVTGLGPGAIADGASGKLMKALAQELLASVAEMDGALLAAGSADGADAAQGGHFNRVFETRSIGAKGGQKPRAVDRSSPRQIAKQETVGMRVKELSDLFFVPGNVR